jgi:hypothetical protein
MPSKADRIKSLRRKVKIRKLDKDLKKEKEHRVLFKGKLAEHWSGDGATDTWVEIREYPPMKRTINYEHEYRCSNPYRIQFPYQIFIFVTTDYYKKRKNYYENYYGCVATYFAFAKDSIKNKESEVYFPALPNTEKNFSVCLGDLMEAYEYDENLPTPTPDEIVDYYWNSTFTVSLSNDLFTLKQYFGSFSRWEELSLKQVNENLKWPSKFTTLLKKAGINDDKVYLRRRIRRRR